MLIFILKCYYETLILVTNYLKFIKLDTITGLKNHNYTLISRLIG